MDEHFKLNVEDYIIKDIKYNKECPECGLFNRDYYCKPCDSMRFRANFAHWTSGDLN